MKAKNINGQIKIFNKIPNIWNNILNFNNSTNDLFESEGFYDVIIPAYNENKELSDIYFDSLNKYFTYEVINKTVEQIDFENRIKDWKFLEYSMRIKAPDSLLMQLPGVEVWARYKGLQIVVEGSYVYLYCNVILPEHNTLINSYQELITIENIPTQWTITN